MNKLITNAVLSGLGLASLASDAVRKSARDLVNESKLTKEEGRKLVLDFQRRLKQAERTLEKKVDAAVRTALKDSGLTASGKSPKVKPATRSRQRGRAIHVGVK